MAGVVAAGSAVVAAGRCSARTGGNGFLLHTADESRDVGSRVDRALAGLYSVR